MHITGATRVCFFVGSPIDKARTPRVFNDWASTTGHDVVMVGLSIDAEGIKALFDAMRHWDNCVGAVITFPHKQAAFSILDEADLSARANESCNVVRRESDGRLVGTMTDGIGCVDAMENNGANIAGADFLLVGAGGAGSAIAHEAASRGIQRLVVIELDQERRNTFLSRLTAEFPALGTDIEAPCDFRYDIVCNATPLGMNGETAMPYALAALPSHTLVVDVVPTPTITPWLGAAKERGLRIQTGPEMVVSQFEHVAGHLLGIPVGEIKSQRAAFAAT